MSFPILQRIKKPLGYASGPRAFLLQFNFRGRKNIGGVTYESSGTYQLTLSRDRGDKW